MAYSTVVTARTLVQSYSGFWRELMPMGEEFLRSLNRRLERFALSVESDVDPSRRGLVNECGFRLFEAQLEEGPETANSKLDVIETKAIALIMRMPRQVGAVARLSGTELDEVHQLAHQLHQFISSIFDRDTLTLAPAFAGCGRLLPCSGDMLIADLLLEVKAGDRDFRLVDLRQLLTYAALNHQSAEYQISTFGLVNPRTGLWAKFAVEELCRIACGRSIDDTLWSIADFVTADVTSR